MNAMLSMWDWIKAPALVALLQIGQGDELRILRRREGGEEGLRPREVGVPRRAALVEGGEDRGVGAHD